MGRRGGSAREVLQRGEQPVGDLLADFERNGLKVGRLEREGLLLMRSEEDPLKAREEALGRLLEEETEKGRTA